MLSQVTLQLGHGYPGLDGGREIGWVVMHDAAQARKVEDPVEAREPVSNSDPGATSPRGYGEAVLRRLGKRVAKPLQIGQADGGRLESVYRVCVVVVRDLSGCVRFSSSEIPAGAGSISPGVQIQAPGPTLETAA